MSTNTETNQEIRLEELKAKATLLGIKHAANIRLDTLETKIEEFETASAVSIKDQILNVNAKPKGALSVKQAAELPRLVRVSNLDVEERDHTTIYKCVLNENFAIARVIPVDQEWYVPQAVCDALENSMMQVHVKEMDKRTNRFTGNRVAKQVKKYNVQYL